MTKTAILLTVMLAACQPVAPSEVFQVQSGDYGFAADEFELMRAEADRLCDATSGRYCPALTRDLAANVVMKAPDMPGVIAGNTTVTQDLESAAVTIIIEEWLDRETLRRIWRHELGHAGGCPGHLEPGNVMAPYSGQQSEDWTAADIACVDDKY